MSGHSKWSTIRRKKGAADAKRGQAFTKYANAIALAARTGADPNFNFKLRLAIDQARAVNVPKSNIDKAIARGSGVGGGAQLEEVTYEGYGPGGVAVIIACATDNKNRTYADVRTAFSKHGGSLAEPGAVSFQFSQKGVIQFEPADIETATLNAIDAGAEDVEVDDKVLTLYTNPKQLKTLQQQLIDKGYHIDSAEISYVPKQTIPITDKATAAKIVKLMATLEDLDDVTATYSNFDIPAEILEEA